ncbi:MAG: Uma2 family endonuclease [Acidobacteriota bacterium]
MSTTTLVTVEQYLLMTEKPYREYRDGQLYPKSTPTYFHGVIQIMLGALLRKLGLQVGSEVSLPISPTKILIPDVIAARAIEQPYPTKPVLLCCEILSPGDSLGATFAKCEEYHAWGVPFCWVVDPEKRTAWEYHNAAEPVRVSDVLHAGDIAISVTELFSSLPALP